MVHITLPANPNCFTTGISGPIDAFSIADLWCRYGGEMDESCAPLFCWDIVTLNGEPVQGHGRVAIQPHCSIHAVDATDFILIPGFFPPSEIVGNVSEELKMWLRSWHAKKTMIGTTCTGTFLLAETGLLDGKIATTHWSLARYFKKLYPKVR